MEVNCIISKNCSLKKLKIRTRTVLNTRGLCGPYGLRAASADDRCGQNTFSVD